MPWPEGFASLLIPKKKHCQKELVSFWFLCGGKHSLSHPSRVCVEVSFLTRSPHTSKRQRCMCVKTFYNGSHHTHPKSFELFCFFWFVCLFFFSPKKERRKKKRDGIKTSLVVCEQCILSPLGRLCLAFFVSLSWLAPKPSSSRLHWHPFSFSCPCEILW